MANKSKCPFNSKPETPFQPQIDTAEAELHTVVDSFESAIDSENEIRNSIRYLVDDVERIAQKVNMEIVLPEKRSDIDIPINHEIDEFLEKETNLPKVFPSLSNTELIFCALAGAISIIVDVVFVGTPEVVKIYHGGNRFDGSRLTALIREIKPDNQSEIGAILKWLSDKCKVPYDLSCLSGVANPNNHRLRGLAHDPFYGLFFAVADLLMGTTTIINDAGFLEVIPSQHSVSVAEKILSVFFYVGHILSDMFTSRGIPIPGFFMTQFFTGNGQDHNLAQIAERMYLDGYDLRHGLSMSVPVAIKDFLIECYCRITQAATNEFLPLALKERESQQYQLKKLKMRFISDSIGAAGNLAKFILPPTCCNPCALNIAQWLSLIQNSILLVIAATRNHSSEFVLDGRERINQKWTDLLQETY